MMSWSSERDVVIQEWSGKVGIIGFCMGGALTVLAAVRVPEADAAVAWYGFPPLEFVDASKITMPLLGHFAASDAYFPPSGVAALAAKLRSAGVAFEFHEYDAEHAFANETGPTTRPQPRAWHGSAPWSS
jgi:carboxymethylenebutenolidase